MPPRDKLMAEMKNLTCDASDSDVTCGHVWLPILGISALHLTHPKCTHTAVNTHTPWTHTRSSRQPFMQRRPGSSWGFGALLKGTSVVVLKVEEYIHSPPPTIPAGPETRSYESDSLTIRPRLPHSDDLVNNIALGHWDKGLWYWFKQNKRITITSWKQKWTFLLSHLTIGSHSSKSSSNSPCASLIGWYSIQLAC